MPSKTCLFAFYVENPPNLAEPFKLEIYAADADKPIVVWMDAHHVYAAAGHLIESIRREHIRLSEMAKIQITPGAD